MALAVVPFFPRTKSANGVWLWTNMLVLSGTFSRSDSSATRSFSCFPPPLVRRTKGIRCNWRKSRDLEAFGSGSELRRSTPSMLYWYVNPFNVAWNILSRYSLESKGEIWGFVFSNGCFRPLNLEWSGATYGLLQVFCSETIWEEGSTPRSDWHGCYWHWEEGQWHEIKCPRQEEQDKGLNA